MRDGSPICVPLASASGAPAAHANMLLLGNLPVATLLTAMPTGAVIPVTSLSLTIFKVPSACTASLLMYPPFSIQWKPLLGMPSSAALEMKTKRPSALKIAPSGLSNASSTCTSCPFTG